MNLNRILLAGIRNQAQCPCPRCLIPLSRVHNLGMARDMMQRVTMPRTDDLQRRSRISSARDIIYEKNLQVDSSAVKELLKEFSWVPNTVCDIYFIIQFKETNDVDRTLSVRDCLLLGSVFFKHCFQMRCTKLNWAVGEPFSFTCYEYSNQLMIGCLWSWTAGINSLPPHKFASYFLVWQISGNTIIWKGHLKALFRQLL